MHDICSHSSIFYFFARSIHVHQLKGDIHFNQINLEMSKILPCQSEHANWWVIICFSPLYDTNAKFHGQKWQLERQDTKLAARGSKLLQIYMTSVIIIGVIQGRQNRII